MRLNIKATWIQNASPQQDALTDLSYMSSLGQQSMNSSGLGSDTVDQVLLHTAHSFNLYLAVWGVESVVMHQTSWLESTGVCGVRQKLAGGSSVRQRATSEHMLCSSHSDTAAALVSGACCGTQEKPSCAIFSYRPDQMRHMCISTLFSASWCIVWS